MLFTVSLGDHGKGVRTRNYLLYMYTTGFGTVCVFVLKSSLNNNLFPPWALFPGGCFNNHGLNHRRSLGRSSLRSYPRGGGGGWGGGQYSIVAHAGKLRPKGVPFSRFWYAVYDGVGISLVKVRMENLSLRSLLKELKRANSRILWL